MVTKLTLTFIVVGFGFFFCGLEYAIILPTMWHYIHEYYGASEVMLGIMMSAFSLADMIFSPMFGVWTDKTRKAKRVTIICAGFQIVGNMLYFFGINMFILILSRFITGIGAGFGTPIIAEMSKTIPSSRLTGLLALVMICRQMGLIFGPAFNIFLYRIHFYIGPFVVNNCTSPGILMAIIWTLYIPVVILLMTDFSRLSLSETSSMKGSTEESVGYGKVDFSMIQSMIKNEPHIDIRKSFAAIDTNKKGMAGVNKSNKEVKKTFRMTKVQAIEHLDELSNMPARDTFRFGKDLCRLDTITILLISFAGMFNQTALEGMLTPLAAIILQWTDKDVSFLFLGCGIEVILVFILLKFLSGYISDCSMLHISNILSIMSLSVFFIFLPVVNPGSRINVVYVVLGVFLQVFSMPFLVVCSVSLYSKITNPTKQGAIQGIRRSFMALATIVGPLWATSLLRHLYTNFGGCILLFLTCELLLIYSSSDLLPKKESHAYLSNDLDFGKELGDGYTKPKEYKMKPLIEESEDISSGSLL